MNHFTTEDMIRFLYNEMSPEESKMAMEAIESDWILKEKYEVLKASKRDLDSIRCTPRKSTIDSILQYAEQESLVK
ncbi:MAG TPA: hypothetical protein VK166_03650 [Chitinophagaceae bacterium]|nr:hypothetical protein [Chitinophagaceae bacterium]